MADPPADQPQKSSPGTPRRGAAESEAAGWYRMAGVGMEFIVAVLLFGGIGWWLDRSFGTRPWLLLAGCGLGFAVGLWLMFKAARKSFR